MKFATLSIVVLLVTLILGCADQTSMVGPQAEQKQSLPQLGKAGYDVSIDKTVIGPQGQKFHVTGTIPFKLEVKGSDCYVQTFVNLTVYDAGTGKTLFAVGGSSFMTSLNPEQENVPSEALDLRADQEPVSYVIIIEYSVKASGVTVTDMIITDSPRVGTATM